MRVKVDDSNAYSQWEHLNSGTEYKIDSWRLMEIVGGNLAKARKNTKVLYAYSKHVATDFVNNFVLKGSGTNFMVGAIYKLKKPKYVPEWVEKWL